MSKQLPANHCKTEDAIIQSPAVLNNNLPNNPTHRKQSGNALLIPQLTFLQMQSVKRGATAQILLHTRIGIDLLTRLKPQSLQILAVRNCGEPPVIHPMIREGQLLQHLATLPNSLNPIKAPFTATKLQLYEPLAPLSKNSQPNIRHHRIVEPINVPNELQNLQIPTRGDPAENVVAAALQFEFLQSGALLGDGEEDDLGGADDMEAVVDDFEREHVVLA